jgi:hypothetical protein
MPEGVGYGANSPAGTGKTLNYLGNHAYGYSGVVETDNNETTLLEFEVDTTLLKGIIQFYYAEPSNDKFLYTVYVNNVAIVKYQVFGPNDTNGEHLLSLPIYIVIPPNTVVKCTAINNENSNSRGQCANFSGRVYK